MNIFSWANRTTTAFPVRNQNEQKKFLMKRNYASKFPFRFIFFVRESKFDFFVSLILKMLLLIHICCKVMCDKYLQHIILVNTKNNNKKWFREIFLLFLVDFDSIRVLTLSWCLLVSMSLVKMCAFFSVGCDRPSRFHCGFRFDQFIFNPLSNWFNI